MNLLVKLGEINEQTWTTVGIVAGIFLGIALLLVVLILVIGKVFKVDVDEKVENILGNLAGANCGGCGCSGCAGFAKQLAEGTGDLSACHVTSPEQKAEIAKLLGIELKEEEPTVAIVHCSGNNDNCPSKFTYYGEQSCSACLSVNGGNKSCPYGCLGCGDCAAVCPENAITVENGVAKINPDKCVSCGACINACPKHLITRVPAASTVYIGCSNQLKGKPVMSACKVGCIGCGICAKNCPSGAITMENNLPIIDYTKCTSCGTCVAKCPRKSIQTR